MNQYTQESLVKWMDEVTSLLLYQPDVPLKHKEDLVKKLEDFKKLQTSLDNRCSK